MMNNTSKLKLGVVLSYIQLAATTLITLIYTPLMMELLGQSEYGLYNTVASTISMLSILSLGFNAGYIRYYSRYNSEKDYKSIYQLNGFFLLLFCMIGIIALLCGVFLSFNLDLVFDKGLSSSELETAKILMMLLTVSLAISFPMSVFQNIITAHEEFVYIKIVGLLKTIMGPMVTIPLLIIGYKSIAVVLVSISIEILADCCYVYFVLIILKQTFIFCFNKMRDMLSLVPYTIFIAINMIVDQVNWNIDKVIIGRYIGTVGVAVYSVGYIVNQLYTSISSEIAVVFTPRIFAIINKYSQDNYTRGEVLTDLFIKVGRIQFFILCYVLVFFIFCGKQFIVLWAGEEYKEAYIISIMLMIPATIPLIQNLGISIQRAMNKHQFRSIVYFFMAIVNFCMSVIFCKKYGVIGVTIGTAFSLLLANGVIINIYYKRACGIDIGRFWKSIIKSSIGVVLPIVFLMISSKYVITNRWGTLVAYGIVYTFVFGISIWFLSMNSYEKDLVYSLVRRVYKE